MNATSESEGGVQNTIFGFAKGLLTSTKSTKRGKRRGNRQMKTRKLKQMNCSPMVGKLKVGDSCYTPKILMTIRDEYNKEHTPSEQIHESDPAKLWTILNQRLVHCEKEDCWLNQIKDSQLRKRIDRYIFAPDKPYEWKKNPNEWLTNYDILNVLEQYEETHKHFEFIGPSPIDFDKIVNRKCVYNELCGFQLSEHMKNGKTVIGVIFNLSPHTSGGSHWVSLFIDTKAKLIFYFDSAGARIPKQIKRFVNRVQSQAMQVANRPYTFEENCPKEHQFGNTECGVYSLFFIITMLTGKTKLTKGLLSAKQKMHLFKNRTIPDKYIEKYRNVYFND
jgi:hypothetical protein